MKTICVINNTLIMKRWAIIGFLSWKDHAKPEDKFVVLECYDQYNSSCIGSQHISKLGLNSKNWYEVLSEEQEGKYGDMKKDTSLSGLNQASAFWDYIKDMDDNEYVELVDPDILYSKPFNYKSTAKIIADLSFENWHMHLMTKHKDIFTKKVIPGAYQPIYGLVKDIKILFPLWIENSLSIVKNESVLKELRIGSKKWWCSMFGFSKTISDLEIEFDFLDLNKVPGYAVGKPLRGYHWAVTIGKNYSKHKIDHLLNNGEVSYKHFDEDIYFHEKLRSILKDDDIFRNNDFSKIINDPQFIGSNLIKNM